MTEATRTEDPSRAPSPSQTGHSSGSTSGGGRHDAIKASLHGHDFDTQVQMLAPGGDAGGDVHAAAAKGISGSSGPLPDQAKIQKSFGGYDISSVHAHMDAAAAHGTAAMGAGAYATGNHIALGKNGTSLHTQAHEAAHVIQQQAGVSLSGGVGEAGDPYEQHADRVADAVVQGKSAEGILGELGASRGAASDAVQLEEDEDAPELDLTSEPEQAPVDPELEAFLKEGIFGPQDLKAPSGLGGFGAEYHAASGILAVRIQGSVDFVDGLEDAGGCVVIANERDLQGAADAANQLIDPADIDAFLADFRWEGSDTAAWLSKMTANVEAAWSGRFEFFMDRPGWEAVSARAQVQTDISASESRADDHVSISLSKVPDSGVYDVGADVSNSNGAYNNAMILSSRDNRTGEERMKSGDMGLLNRQVGPFASGTRLPDANIILQVMQFGADFVDANEDGTNPVHVTGRASSEGSKEVNDELAKERADEVVALLNDEGVKNTRITVEAAGSEGATEDPSWRRVDLKVGDGQTQDVAVHEFGHMLGLDDYYDNAADGRGGTISGTGQAAGTLNRHDQMARDIGVTGGAVHENNDGIMSLGNNVKPADYATVGWALQTVTRRPEWRVRA